MREFDAATVLQLLDELKDRLRAKGVRGTIKVAGGAAMLLNYPDDPDVRVTTDIDALIEPIEEIDEVIAEMAHDLELPRHWLNAAGTSWLRVAGDERNDPISVSVATPQELIAMKLAASRDKDAADLAIIARNEGIDDPAELVDIAYEIYGEDSVELPDGRQSYLWFAADVIDESMRPRRRPRRR
jgi:hypothetical protein